MFPTDLLYAQDISTDVLIVYMHEKNKTESSLYTCGNTYATFVSYLYPLPLLCCILDESSIGGERSEPT